MYYLSNNEKVTKYLFLFLDVMPLIIIIFNFLHPSTYAIAYHKKYSMNLKKICSKLFNQKARFIQ